MLRAIAGYIFGGILKDSTQEALECETREVDDWLVVNMPDQLEEHDLEDFDMDTTSNPDEDDILTCLPFLMTTEIIDCGESSFFEEEMSVVPEAQLFYPPEESVTQSGVLSFLFNESSQFLTKSTRKYDMLHLYDLLRDECLMLTYPDVAVQEVVTPRRPTSEVKIVKCKKVRVQGANKRAKNNDLTCHFVHKPTYINHRPLATAAKTDLLQQIKELEPSQKAQDIALKKHVTRSQLNRQNRNYIYCSTTKTPRRKDLQRNHSGANNNRKC